MNQIPLRVIGMAWYRREDYAHLRKLFEDGRNLPLTFDKWLKRAKLGKERLERQGAIVEKVYIDPEAFPRWCAERGLHIDANGRTQYAAFMAGLMHNKTH